MKNFCYLLVAAMLIFAAGNAFASSSFSVGEDSGVYTSMKPCYTETDSTRTCWDDGHGGLWLIKPQNSVSYIGVNPFHPSNP